MGLGGILLSSNEWGTLVKGTLFVNNNIQTLHDEIPRLSAFGCWNRNPAPNRNLIKKPWVFIWVLDMDPAVVVFCRVIGPGSLNQVPAN